MTIIDIYNDVNTFKNFRNYLSEYFYELETEEEKKYKKNLKKINRIKDPIRRQQLLKEIKEKNGY